MVRCLREGVRESQKGEDSMCQLVEVRDMQIVLAISSDIIIMPSEISQKEVGRYIERRIQSKRSREENEQRKIRGEDIKRMLYRK